MSDAERISKLERENARLADMVARLVKEKSLLINRAMAIQGRIDDDDLNVSRQSSGRRHMWVVMGPSAVLPGSAFHLRTNAIKHAEEAMGMKWEKCRRMGYFCVKVFVVPVSLDG